MSVVRVGTNKKYSENWDSIFARGQKKSARPVAGAKKSAGKKSTAKSVGKGTARGKKKR